MAYKIQIRRDTATNWTSVNPTLGQGELGYETTTGKLKVGDGVKTWTQLDYLIGENDGSIDLGAVDKHVLPATDNVYDLGSPTKQWRELYVSGGSIYVGDIKISNEAGRLIFTQVTNPGQINEAPVPGGTEAFELPTASDTLLGAVKIGDNLTIEEDGTLNAQQGNYQLPTASNVVKGGILIGDNLTIDGEGYLSATVPDVSNFITASDIPTIPSDINQLSDTDNLLGQGGSADTGDITFTDTTISAPNLSTIVVEAKDGDGVANARLILAPNDKLAKLESSDDDNTSFSTNNGYSTAEWTVDQFGDGELVFSDALALYNFIDRSSTAWDLGSNRTLSWNGDDQRVQYSGNYSWNGGINELTLRVGSATPPEDPTEVTLLTFDWTNTSRISVDSYDFEAVEIFGRGIPVRINTTDRLNVDADDIRLYSRFDENSYIRLYAGNYVRIRTNDHPDGLGTKEWQFNNDGTLTFPDSTVQTTAFTGSSISNGTTKIDIPDEDGDISIDGNVNLYGGFKIHSGGEPLGTNDIVFFDSGTESGRITTMGETGGAIQIQAEVNFEVKVSQTFDPDTPEEATETALWNFRSNGGLELPAGGTIVEGVVTENPTIELTPANPEAESQKLIIKGGQADNLHLHLTTGDLTETSVFLGTDEHNVRTYPDGTVIINTYDYGAETPEVKGFTFTPFDRGQLFFPDGTLQSTAWAGGRVKLFSPVTSKGEEGDKERDIAFDNNYFYYCTADYTDGQADIWKRVAWSNDVW